MTRKNRYEAGQLLFVHFPLHHCMEPLESFYDHVIRCHLVLLEVGDPEGARTAFEAALAVRPDDPVALGSFAAVIAASMLISWSAEAAQFLISQGLAVAIIALLQVLPEFMIEFVFAYRGDTPNMLANLTGSNRLLMGLGSRFPT